MPAQTGRTRKKIGFWLALFLLQAVASLGCDSSGSSRASARKGIITFGPNITETVFALGQGDRIVGVTDFCDYPPEAKSIQRVGGYLDPDLETITALAPELIILPGKMEKLAALAQQNGYRILNAHMDDVKSIHESVRAIGDALDCAQQAEALCARIDADLDAVRKSTRGKPRPKVLLINTRQSHDLNNLFTVGRLSFMSELTDIAGGDNIFNDADNPYFEASKESVVARAPDVIVEFHAGENLSPEEQARYIADWDELSTVPAVQNGRVHLFLESYGLRPGPRVGLIAKQLSEMLHPAAGEKEL
ncbi:MAG: ABC transporter substrate-binding protein [Candidatus Hydrogenedentes bacterium]|nr:ABC transporter substrate-binding protein [Candidatus Hydrogenedentota bacterium]